MRALLIACAGGLMLTGPALAQELTTGHLPAMDTNGDGSVDATEFTAYIEKSFALLDANGDGFISVTEAQAYMTPEQFAAADKNGDKGLSKREYAAAAQADFAAADVNGDGVLN